MDRRVRPAQSKMEQMPFTIYHLFTIGIAQGYQLGRDRGASCESQIFTDYACGDSTLKDIVPSQVPPRASAAVQLTSTEQLV